jgi:hypothetical protein
MKSLKAKEKRLRRKARLIRNRVIDAHRDRVNELFRREGAGEDITSGCHVTDSPVDTCLLCLEEKRFEAEYAAATRAVNWFWYSEGHRRAV